MSRDEPNRGEPGPARANARTARRLARAQRRRKTAGVDHKLILAYDGEAFAGYARQPGRDTVEARVRAALEPLAPGLRRVAVAGRTDRGVSAVGQVVSFRADELVSPDLVEAALDEAAPGKLACLSATIAPRGFHAQFWAVERRYAYLLPGEPSRLALAPRLDRLLRGLVGTRSFTAFARETPPGQSVVRTVRSASCTIRHLDETPVLAFELAATGFLRRMVRVVVASALDAAGSGAPDDALARLAAAEDRSATSAPAPPEPLRLERIAYPVAPKR